GYSGQDAGLPASGGGDVPTTRSPGPDRSSGRVLFQCLHGILQVTRTAQDPAHAQVPHDQEHQQEQRRVPVVGQIVQQTEEERSGPAQEVTQALSDGGQYGGGLPGAGAQGDRKSVV